MAELIIQNPSITSGDFSFSGDAITAIAGHPVAGVGGGGTQSDYVYVPSFNDQTGDITFTLGVTGSEGKGPWHISGAQGPAGENGKSLSAEYEEDSVNRQTQVKIGQIDGSVQTTFNLPWGVNGTNGANGTSLSAKTSTITGGHRVEIWEKGASQYDDSFDVMDGEDGVSPTVTVTNIPADPDDPNHKNGGTEITITDATTTNKFSAWNGNDGTMAGAPGIEGNKGISATLDGSTYKVGLSAGFYSAVTSVSSKLDESDFTTYTATTAPGAFQPKGDYLTEVAASGSIIGTGLSTNKIGLVTSAENALTAVANKVTKPDTTQTDLNNNYLIYSTLTGAGTTTGWMPLSANYYSKSEADGRYQKKEDMGNYLTTAQYETDSAKYVSTGDILTAVNNTLTGIKIGNTNYAIPDDYAKPTGNYQNLSAGSATSAYSAYSANYATTAASAYIDSNTTSAMSNIVNELHGKSSVTISTDQVVTTNNNGTTACVSAAQYVYNDSFNTAPKQLFVCQDDNDLTAHLSICNGKGTLFFVCSAI